MAGGRQGMALGEIARAFGRGQAVGVEDGPLLHRFAARGDDVAFEALVGRHGPMVLATCRRMLADPADVEDAFQATFLVLVEKAARLRGDDLGPWLHAVAYRVAARSRARTAARAIRERKAARSEFCPPAPGPERGELASALDEEIHRLPPHHRRAVVLCDLEGLAHEEAAGRLRCSPGALRGRLDRARARLRSRLVRRGLAPAVGLAPWPLAAEAARPALTPALVAATLAAASRVLAGRGPVAAPSLLAREVIQTMSRAKLRLAALSAGGLLALSLSTLPLAPAGDEPGRRPAVSPDADATASGRVLDADGRPIAGARVRLYHRPDRWERRNPVIEEVTTGGDGSYRITSKLEHPSPVPGPSLPPYLLVADRPGLAVGWRTPSVGASFSVGDIILTPPAERTVRVVDPDGRPVEGAKVIAYEMGDPSSPSPLFRRDSGQILADDGPLTAMSGPDGRASFPQAPRTRVACRATKPGFAETFAFPDQDTIRLTPSGSLSGTLTGPDGRPLAGVKVVLYTKFMWDFYHAVTDERGQYRLDDLKAKGWDMGAWTPGKTADGDYRAWIESDRFAVPTQSLIIEPGVEKTLDLRAQEAGVIRVTLLEERTKRPVAGARIWGFDRETGSSARFNASTDARGVAIFHSAPASINLSLASPPAGVFLEADLHRFPGAARQLDFPGGETEITLTMPAVAGRLIPASGLCTRPDGSPAAGARVWASGGSRVAKGASYGRAHRVDDGGRFELDAVASASPLNLLARTEDGTLAGSATVMTPAEPEPGFRAVVPLLRTHPGLHAITDSRGLPLPHEPCDVTPQVGGDDMIWLRESLKSDDAGMVRVEHAIPGVAYRFQVYRAANDAAKARGGPFLQVHDEVEVLIPAAPK